MARLIPNALADGAGRANAFLLTLQNANATGRLGDGGIGKQLRFQAALLAIKEVLCTVSGFDQFFLVCGTALGARRDGYFIPHDDDIDVGVFWEDLVAFGRRQCTKPSDADSISVVETDGADPALEKEAASAGVQRLLSDMACHGDFLCFDVCGSVDFGAEFRLLHAPTGVRLDLNVYYTTQESRVAGGEPFTWSATFYEEADKRTHGMYRYRHTPFRHLLEPTLFCSRSAPSEAAPSDYFRVPPVSYLEEYFGHDWGTPKRYSYAEGLQGEYKNIIDE